jgi:hypothetical protein
MNKTNPPPRAQRLREMAAETRTLAKDAGDSKMRKKLIELADQLDKLASRLEPH